VIGPEDKSVFSFSLVYSRHWLTPERPWAIRRIPTLEEVVFATRVQIDVRQAGFPNPVPVPLFSLLLLGGPG